MLVARPTVWFAFALRVSGAGILCTVFDVVLSAATYQAGDWRVDVSVVADQPSIVLGEPAWLSFVVANRAEEPLQLLVGGDYQNQLGRPGSFTIHAVGKDGKLVAQPDAGLGTGGLVGPQDLPVGGSHSFRLFVPHWATFTESGTYTIRCRRTLQLFRPAAGRDFVKQPTTDVVVEARTELHVLPRDSARLGRLIDERGETMLRESGGKAGDDAVIDLAWIDDPRVVPYFRRALQLPSYALRFVAVQVLGRFATDEAFAGLRAAMALTAADFAHAGAEKSPGLAARIRGAAAGALGRSRHPQARDFLLAQRGDEAENVRLTVVHAMARLPTAQALPLLEEMARDRSELVRDEAMRYAALLRQPPARAAKKP